MEKTWRQKIYRFRNVIAVLIGISIISCIVAMYFNGVNTIDRYRADLKGYINNNVYDSISNTENYRQDNSFPYHVKSYKVKYFDSKGKALPDREGEERYKKYIQQKELEEKGLNPFEYQSERLEEITKKATVFYMSNDGSHDFDPSSMEFPDSDFWIQGHYTNGVVTFDDVYESEEIKDSNLWYLLASEYKNAIQSVYTSSIMSDKVINISFAYDVNIHAPYVDNFYNRTLLNQLTLDLIPATLLLTALLTAIYTLFLKYQKLKEENERIWAFELPLEVIFVLFCIYGVCGMLGIDLLESNQMQHLLMQRTLLISIVGVCICVANFIFSLCVFYGVMFWKSLYYEKIDNYVFRHSFIIRGIRRFLHETNVDIGATEDEKTMRKAKKKVLWGLVVLFVLGAIYFVMTSRVPLFTNLIYLGVLYFIYYCISRLLGELLNINRSSSEIVKGNYEAKVENTFPVTRKIADNFNSISTNLNTAVDNAIKSERMKSELITNVSHDLKTPLTSILNYSDLLQNKDVSRDEQKEYAQIIYEKSLKLKTLIEDLFEVSKATSKNIDLNLEDLDFQALLMQVIGEWEDKLEEKDIQLVTNLQEKPIIVPLDGSKTSRVLDNLFTNLDKYAMEHSRVYIDLKKTEEEVVLEIKNMSKYALNITAEELLQRFTRGDVSRNTEGSGLGLSIAKSLVEAQGGSFEVDIDGDLFKSKIIF